MPGTRREGRPTRASASGSSLKGSSQLDRHAVLRRSYLGADALRQLGRDRLGIGAPDRHPIVGQDRELRFGLADDALSVVDAEVGKLRPAVQQDRVDQHHLCLVLLRYAVVIGGIGDPAEPVAKTKTVRLDLMDMTAAGRERHTVDRVRRFRGEADDLAWEPAQVLEDDWVFVERVVWA